MGRQPREDIESAVHHVYARGVRRTQLFIDERDYRTYLRLLARAHRRYRWRCLAYCLMPNHVHLMIETPEANLGAGMSSLHSGFARAFNDRHGTVGHVFQGRYGAKRLVTDTHLWTTVRYIARNPVEAQLCSRAEEWPWGSDGSVAGGTIPAWLAHQRLLELLSGATPNPNLYYERLVRGGT